MSITGNLRTLEISELLQWLAHGRKTGTLVVEHGAVKKKLFFEEGRIVGSASTEPTERLGHHLLAGNLVDAATLERARNLQEATKIYLGRVLVTLGSISETDLKKALRQKTEDSIFELFTWSEGDFHFLGDELPSRPLIPISLDVTNLVLEGMHRLDEDNLRVRSSSTSAGAEMSQPTRVIKPDGLDPRALATDLSTPETEETVQTPVGNPSGESSDETQPPDPPDAHGLYQSIAKRELDKRLLWVAAAVVALGLSLWAGFALFGSSSKESIAAAREEMSDVSAGIAELPAPHPSIEVAEGDLESSAPLELLDEEPGAADPPELAETEAAVIEAAVIEAAVIEARVGELVAARSQELEGSMRAKYEQELTALRQQLAEAEQRAEEPGSAPVETSAPEPTPSQASGGATEPEARGMPVTVPPATRDEAPSGPLLPADTASASGPGQPGEEADILQAEARPEPTDQRVEDTERPPEPPPATPQPAAVETGELVGPGEGVSPPSVLRQPPPGYPPAARRMHRAAVVTVRVLVDENGKVIDTEPTGAKAGLGFDEAALEAAGKTTWKPATKSGVRVKMWVDLKIDFRP